MFRFWFWWRFFILRIKGAAVGEEFGCRGGGATAGMQQWCGVCSVQWCGGGAVCSGAVCPVSSVQWCGGVRHRIKICEGNEITSHQQPELNNQIP
ncbi:hypothetical protein SOVF_088730 [Spinacia oleracea]|nr:hypothetical protein SOVF_088730 [Spinacia oleracea]